MPVPMTKPSPQSVANWRAAWRQELPFSVVWLVVMVHVFVNALGAKGLLIAPLFIGSLGLLVYLVMYPFRLAARLRPKTTIWVSRPNGWRFVMGRLRLDASGLSWTPTWGGRSKVDAVFVPRVAIDRFEVGRAHSFIFHRFYSECVLRDGTSFTFVHGSKKSIEAYLREHG